MGRSGGNGQDEQQEPEVARQWTLPMLEERGVTLRTVNVLGHGDLRAPVDVKRLALLVRNADYSQRGFNALVMRFQSPRASVLVYRSGKLYLIEQFVVIGVKSPEDAHVAVEKLRGILQKVEFPSNVASFYIANVVMSADLKFKVRLEGLARLHSRFCTYEPELFPGLIYRMITPKCTLLIFVSGKVVITGCKSPGQGEEVLCKLFPVLLQLRIHKQVRDDEEDEEEAKDHETDSAIA